MKLQFSIPKKTIWRQSKPQLLSSVPYPPSQPEMACRVWNLHQGRELDRVRKEAVGKSGTTFLLRHVGLRYKYLVSHLIMGRVPHQQ